SFINSQLNGADTFTVPPPTLNPIIKSEVNISDKTGALNRSPVFSVEDISAFCLVLKPYFSVADYTKLENLLSSELSIDSRLVFNGNGNGLANAFKQLYDAQLIYGCSKIEMESWLARNFCYFSKGKKKNYSLKYLNDIISSQNPGSKRPILKI